MYVGNNGNIGIGTTDPTEKLQVNGTIYNTSQFLGSLTDSATAPGYSFKDNTNTGIFHAATNTIALSTNGTEQMRINTSGNVGIGTNDPLYKLHVIGDTEIDGYIYGNVLSGVGQGVVTNYQIYRLGADLPRANVNTVQSIFGVGVSFAGSTTYYFEAVIGFKKTAGATSHIMGFSFGGTATVTNIYYQLIKGPDNTSYNTSVATTMMHIIQTTNTQIYGAVATATVNRFASLIGTVAINAAGTFIPQFTLSAAPGGAYSIQAGSYFRIAPGGIGATISQGTWA